MKTSGASRQVRFSDTRLLVAPSDSETEFAPTTTKQNTAKLSKQSKQNSGKLVAHANCEQVLSATDLQAKENELKQLEDQTTLNKSKWQIKQQQKQSQGRSIETELSQSNTETCITISNDNCNTNAQISTQQCNDKANANQTNQLTRASEKQSLLRVAYSKLTTSKCLVAFFANKQRALFGRELAASFLFAFASSYVLILAQVSSISSTLLSTNAAQLPMNEALTLDSAGARLSRATRVSVLYGVGLFAIVACVGRVFVGCQLSVGVSLALLVKSEICFRQFLASILAQLLGALLAIELLALATGTQAAPLQYPDNASNTNGGASTSASTSNSNSNNIIGDTSNSQAPLESRWSSLVPFALPSSELAASGEFARKKHYQHLYETKRQADEQFAKPTEFELLLNGSQMFVFQMFAVCIVVLTHLSSLSTSTSQSTPVPTTTTPPPSTVSSSIGAVNTLRTEQLSVSTAYFCASLLSAQSGNFFPSPFVFVAVFLKSSVGDKTASFPQHWAIYLLAPLLGGLVGGLSHEYVARATDAKPPIQLHNNAVVDTEGSGSIFNSSTLPSMSNEIGCGTCAGGSIELREIVVVTSDNNNNNNNNNVVDDSASAVRNS